MAHFSSFIQRFMWDFKRMDNINYNFKIVETCLVTYSSFTPHEDKKYFYKPIFLTLAGIIECILYDFLCRTQEHKNEKIRTISAEDIRKIRNSNIPQKFATYIDICKKYSLLGKKDDTYKHLKKISIYRNKIHIQLVGNQLPRDEEKIWNSGIVIFAGKILKELCIFMVKNYTRPPYSYSPDFTLNNFCEPWSLLK